MNGNRRWLGWAALGLGAWLLLGGIFGRGWHSEREVFGGPMRGRGGFTQQDGGYQQGYQDGLNATRQGGGNTGGNATGGSYQQGYQDGYQDGLNATQGRGGREQVRGGGWGPGWDDDGRRHGHGFFFPLLLLPLLLGGFLLLRRRGGPPWMGGHRCREHQGLHSQPATQQAPAQAPAAPAPQPASGEQDPPGPATGATRQL